MTEQARDGACAGLVLGFVLHSQLVQLRVTRRRCEGRYAKPVDVLRLLNLRYCAHETAVSVHCNAPRHD